MANCSRGRGRSDRAAAAQPLNPSTPEPPVRRWPHPIDGAAPARNGAQDLYYIHCALSYQNQLLADIKALLQQLCPPGEDSSAV